MFGDVVIGRPRKFLFDPRTGKQVLGLSLHRPSGVVYSLAAGGTRVYWGRQVTAAIDAYMASQVAAAEVEPTPNRQPISLREAGDQWRRDKQRSLKPTSLSYPLAHWKEFTIWSEQRGVARISLIDKAHLRGWREWTQERAPSTTWWVSRFRSIKAILRHTAIEHDISNSAEIKESTSLLKTVLVKSANRWIRPHELHALLEQCDHEANTELPTRRHTQSEKAKLARARDKQYLAIQLKAIYLLSLNCMFYPVDIATVPTSAIDLRTGHVHFRRAKKNTVRVGILLSPAKQAVIDWLNAKREATELLFCTTRRTPWSNSKLAQKLQTHRRLCNLPDDLTFKAFRKGGYRAALQDERTDIYTAKILAGHATGITDSYVDANPERCRQAVESIGAFYTL